LPKDNPFSRRHCLHDRFVVSHAGNLGYVYDVETLIDAAALLRDRSDILFLVVGDGVAKPPLVAQATRLGLSNVQFLPFQPTHELPALRATSDTQVSLYRSGSARYSMPSKLYEIMASGRPLLASADPDSDVARLVAETGCGLLVPPGDPRALADAVLRLRNDPALAGRLASAGRAAAEASYSRDVVVDAYERLLRQVAARRHAPAPGAVGRSPGLGAVEGGQMDTARSPRVMPRSVTGRAE
jgi:colanic acid biosynthesis glycosyl transferase WcaI